MRRGADVLSVEPKRRLIAKSGPKDEGCGIFPRGLQSDHKLVTNLLKPGEHFLACGASIALHVLANDQFH